MTDTIKNEGNEVRLPSVHGQYSTGYLSRYTVPWLQGSVVGRSDEERCPYSTVRLEGNQLGTQLISGSVGELTS